LAHTPFMALRLFFIVTSLPSFISRIVPHRTQYACIASKMKLNTKTRPIPSIARVSRRANSLFCPVPSRNLRERGVEILGSSTNTHSEKSSEPTSFKIVPLETGSLKLGETPRPASASRALLQLTPCYRADLRTREACTSGLPGSLELMGGEYKTRERIHRSIADLRLLAIPTS